MVDVQGLTRRYGDAVAVDDLSFRTEPGLLHGPPTLRFDEPLTGLDPGAVRRT